ncbi:MAG TPA: phosphatidate cytidylyltransferase [Alphaproteobacteria bacterium]|nr:phosphatidate cytidylyltransferase [Alphaproteobacteria bacterium]
MADRGPSAVTLRVVSTLVLAPIALGAILLGRPYFEFMVAAGVAVLAWEWDRLCGSERFGLVGGVLVASVVASVAAAGFGHVTAAFALIAAGVLGAYGASRARRVANPLWHAAGPIYVGVPSVAMVWLRGDFGVDVALWLFLAVWATDVGAYAAGRTIGGPQLAPRVSPNKTWSGLAGGILAAALVGAAMGYGRVELAPLVALSAALAIVAQLGDLAESAVKRRFKVKDASGLIPGHGGLLDRVDGLLAAAPMVALVELVARGGVPSWP